MENFKYSVAIVDDERESLYTYSLLLKQSEIEDIVLIEDSRELPVILKERAFSLILLDLSMPNISGFELLKFLTIEYPEIPVIIITALKDIDTAVECIKMGACDYLVKPVEKNKLISSIKKALEIDRLKEEIKGLKHKLIEDKLENETAFSEIITLNQKMRGLFKYIEVISKTEQPGDYHLKLCKYKTPPKKFSNIAKKAL